MILCYRIESTMFFEVRGREEGELGIPDMPGVVIREALLLEGIF